MNRAQRRELEDAIGELDFAEDCLYAAANNLSRAHASDPTVPQIGALAKQVRQVIDVLKARK